MRAGVLDARLERRVLEEPALQLRHDNRGLQNDRAVGLLVDEVRPIRLADGHSSTRIGRDKA